jgi:hypothetical protein
LRPRAAATKKNSIRKGYDKNMACSECSRLEKAEIDCARLASDASSLLESFSPEPPFGEVAANQLHSFELGLELSRASLEKAKRERLEHMETHKLTMCR